MPMQFIFKKLIYACCLYSIIPNLSLAQKSKVPIIIAEQGSFAVGGKILKQGGNFTLTNALAAEGQTFHGDHAAVFYQIPQKANKWPLVFLHGAGQSKRTWESTPDGREGFQNLFLRKHFSVYLVDQPRRAAAGRSTIPTTIKPTADEYFWFSQFRLGNYPEFFENVQFPRDEASLEQFYRQMTPNTGDFDATVVSDALSALINKIQGAILVTHSQGGGPGWMTAIKNNHVKGIVAYEPYSGFVFPENEAPEPINSTGLFGPLKAQEISKTDFLKLTKIPIVLYYGDNIAEHPSDIWNKDHWRAGLEMATKFVALINQYGGNAQLIHFPKIGIYGNTHFPFTDLNNERIAEELSNWILNNQLAP